METPNLPAICSLRPAWNKGRIVGQKRPLKPKRVWAIRVRFELAENHRDLALLILSSTGRFYTYLTPWDSLCESIRLHGLHEQATSHRYRTTNWSSYNAALRKRGSLLIWVGRDMT